MNKRPLIYKYQSKSVNLIFQTLCYEEKPPTSFYLPVFWKSHTNSDETIIPYELISFFVSKKNLPLCIITVLLNRA